MRWIVLVGGGAFPLQQIGAQLSGKIKSYYCISKSQSLSCQLNRVIQINVYKCHFLFNHTRFGNLVMKPRRFFTILRICNRKLNIILTRSECISISRPCDQFKVVFVLWEDSALAGKIILNLSLFEATHVFYKNSKRRINLPY